MTDQEELEQWRLIHILHGNVKPEHCWHQCHDDFCSRGCLNQKANVFRPEIMHGVEILRRHSDPRFPLIAGTAFNSRRGCPDGNLGKIGSTDKLCNDPVCAVTGCLEKPAYNFRELIKVARDEELIAALKK